MARVLALSLFASVATLPLSAQVARQPPTFEATADVVKVDVVVTDDEGQPVPGLSRDDFSVYEDGRAQPLALFEAVDVAATAGRATVPGAAGAPARPAAAPATLVVVFDEPHLTALATERVRRRLREVLAENDLGPTDVTLLSIAGGGAWHARLPEESELLSAALKRFQGAKPAVAAARMNDVEAHAIALLRDNRVLSEVYRRYIDQQLLVDPTSVRSQGQTRSGPKPDDLPAAGQAALRSEAEAHWRAARARQLGTLRALAALLDGLGARPGPKAVLLLSEGFVYDHSLVEMRQVQEAARRARASLHLVHPGEILSRLFWFDAESAETLDTRDLGAFLDRSAMNAAGAESLALGSGGSVLRGLTGLGAGLTSITAGLRTGYLLGYTPPDARRDGRYHKLGVKLRRPGLRLRVRPGYYALAHDEAPPTADIATSLSAAFGDRPAGVLSPLRLAAFVLGAPGEQGTRVRVVAELPTAELRAESAEFLLQVVARDRSDARYWTGPGAVSREREWLRVEAAFELPPGAYQVQGVVREVGSGRLASARLPLDLAASASLRVSTPIVTDELHDGAPVPRAVRRFRSSATLHCALAVLGASAAGPVSAGASLESADGEVWLELPLAPFAGPRTRQWSIPLGDLPPGPYALVIQVEDEGTGEGLTRREEFEVLPDDAHGAADQAGPV